MCQIPTLQLNFLFVTLLSSAIGRGCNLWQKACHKLHPSSRFLYLLTPASNACFIACKLVSLYSHVVDNVFLWIYIHNSWNRFILVNHHKLQLHIGVSCIFLDLFVNVQRRSNCNPYLKIYLNPDQDQYLDMAQNPSKSLHCSVHWHLTLQSDINQRQGWFVDLIIFADVWLVLSCCCKVAATQIFPKGHCRTLFTGTDCTCTYVW